MGPTTNSTVNGTSNLLLLQNISCCNNKSCALGALFLCTYQCKAPLPPSRAIEGIRASFDPWVLPQGWGICILPISDNTCSVYYYKGSFTLFAAFPGTHQGNSRGLVGDFPKISAPGVRLLQPLCDKSPPFPGWGGVGLCIDRCISLLHSLSSLHT